jgi:hypothetical protein
MYILHKIQVVHLYIHMGIARSKQGVVEYSNAPDEE